MDNVIVARLRESVENEARSCSMDFGCVTPLYVYRMWGGSVTLDEIEEDLSHYCEKKIDDSPLSDEEKQEKKRQMKLYLEVYIQGVKDGLRMNGRLM